MKYLILASVLLAGCASVPETTVTATIVTPASACAEEGGCYVLSKRRLQAGGLINFNAGFARGQAMCPKDGI